MQNLSNTPSYRTLDPVLEKEHGSFVEFINAKMIEKVVSAETSCRKYTRGSLKAVALIGGPIARIPFASIPLKYAGKNKTYGAFLVYGNTASYGSLISWCLFKIVSSETENLSASEKKLTAYTESTCLNKMIKAIIGILGVLAQVPFAYMSYVYNDKNLIYPVAVLVLDSGFPIYSLIQTVDAVAKRKTLFGIEKELFSLKEKLIAQFEDTRAAFAQAGSEKRTAYIREIQNVKNLDEDINKVKQFVFLLSHRNYFATPESDSGTAVVPTERCVRGWRYILGGGTAATLMFSQLYFLETLTFEASKLITGGHPQNSTSGDSAGSIVVGGNIPFSYTAGVLVSGINAFLSYNILFQTSFKTYDFVVGLFRKKNPKPPAIAELVKPNLRKGCQMLALATVGLSYAGPIEVSKDYWKGDMSMFMQVTGVMSTIMLGTYALMDFIDDAIATGTKNFGAVENQELIEIDQHLQKLISLVRSSPMIEFAKFLDVLPEDTKDRWLKELKLTSDRIGDYIRERSHEPDNKNLNSLT